MSDQEIRETENDTEGHKVIRPKLDEEDTAGQKVTRPK